MAARTLHPRFGLWLVLSYGHPDMNFADRLVGRL